MVFVSFVTRFALKSLDRQRWTELLSLCTFSAMSSRVALGVFATVRSTSMSVGFRLYRQLSRSWQVAPFFVICWMSMVDILC